MIRTLETVFAALAGLAFGSFLNLCVSRWPEGESIVRPRSHCRGCGRTLAWWENVPLVSWLALGGRCRSCKTWIGWRYPLVEAAVGALWAYTWWASPIDFLNSNLPASACYSSAIAVLGKMTFFWILVALAVLDAENLWLPDWIILPGAALGFIAILARAKLNSDTTLSYSGALGLQQRVLYHIASRRLLSILAAAGLILLIRLVYWLIRHQEGIGLGDAKLMAMLAAWLGLPGALLAFGLGAGIGAAVALFWLTAPSARAKSGEWGQKKLPFGTFLCLGGIVSGLWGEPMIAVYLRWAGF